MWLLVFALLGEVDWGPIKTNENIHLVYDPESFGPPELLPAPINSLGWEDSPEIDAVGTTLTFMYMRLDLTLYLTDGVERFHTPPRAEYSDVDDYRKYCSDILFATNDGGTWTVTNPGSPINTPYGFEGSASRTNDGKTIRFSRSWTDPRGNSHRGLFEAKRRPPPDNTWRLPTLMGMPINRGTLPPNSADNPFYHDQSKRLYWENNDAGHVNIFYTPVPIPPVKRPPSATAFPGNDGTDDDTQIWIDITQPPSSAIHLFCRNHVAIYIYQPGVIDPPLGLLATGAVEDPPAPNAGGIGEPSLDLVNGYLYLIYIFKAVDPVSGKTFHDPDIIRLPLL